MIISDLSQITPVVSYKICHIHLIFLYSKVIHDIIRCGRYIVKKDRYALTYIIAQLHHQLKLDFIILHRLLSIEHIILLYYLLRKKP